MSITKLQHEKLLATIDRLRTELADTRGQKAIDTGRIRELEAEYERELASRIEMQKQRDEEREERRLLATSVAIRDEALVQMTLRIAPYGDPASAR